MKKDLLKRRAELLQAESALLAQMSDGGSTEQWAEADKLKTNLETIDAEIAKLEALESRARANAAARGSGVVVHDNREDKPWASMGEFLQGVVTFGQVSGERDVRLVKLAASGANEAVQSEGGFLVAPQFASELFKLAHDADPIASRCREIVVSGNALKMPAVDESSRANGSRYGGVQAYWAAEAATVTATKPALRQVSLELKKLMALCYMTDEVMQDAPALEAYIRYAFPQEMAFKLGDSIMNGNGVGQPLGYFTNSSLYQAVTKKTSQTATTVVAENITAMWGRMYRPSRANAVWLVNPDVENQLPLMSIGQQPVYLPSGSLANPGAYGLLMGRPVIPCEQCATLGTVGDIQLVDLSQYLLIRKGGLQADSSMHVRFLYDEMAFRFILRVDGAPLWTAALTPYKGSNALTPFVMVETRS